MGPTRRNLKVGLLRCLTSTPYPTAVTSYWACKTRLVTSGHWLNYLTIQNGWKTNLSHVVGTSWGIGFLLRSSWTERLLLWRPMSSAHAWKIRHSLFANCKHNRSHRRQTSNCKRCHSPVRNRCTQQCKEVRSTNQHNIRTANASLAATRHWSNKVARYLISSDSGLMKFKP